MHTAQMTNQTIRQALLCVTACIGLLVSSTTLATNTVLVEHNDKTWIAPLPEGYCNATETFLGIALLDYLDAHFANMDKDIARPTPKVAFTRCGFESDFDNVYPWGWIGFEDINLSHKNQNPYNVQVEELLGSSRFIKKLTKIFKDSSEETFDDYGADVTAQGLQMNGVLWKDDSVVVFQQTQSFEVEGESMVEVVVAASTLMDGFAIHYYVRDLLGGVTTSIESAEKLISNAHQLISLN